MSRRQVAAIQAAKVYALQHGEASLVRFRSTKSNEGSLESACRERVSQQAYQRNHAQSSTVLPSTDEKHHPGLLLIHRKSLRCRQVCQQRKDETLESLNAVTELIGDLGEQDGSMDESVFQGLVYELILQQDPQFSDDELDLLMHFVPVCSAGVASTDADALTTKLQVVLTLWHLSRKLEDEWLGNLKSHLHRVPVLEILRQLNCGEPVSKNEALWVQEKFLSIPCDPSLDQKKLFLCLAFWFSSRQFRPVQGLNRQQLMNRLKLERTLYAGLIGMLLWGGINALFAASSIIAGSLENCRGTMGNLDSHLDLQEAQKVSSMDKVHVFAKAFSSRVAHFVPLSRVYFGGGDVWILHDGLETFSRPKRLPRFMKPIPNEKKIAGSPFFIGKSFTLQTWVAYKGALPKEGFSLLRKAMPGVTSSKLSCWNWRFPPALCYGAHDYGGTGPNSVTGLLEEYVAAAYPQSVHNETARSVMHTLVVTPTSASFMVDSRILAEVPLPRPVTDCESSELTLGDSGVTLGSVKFIPRALSPEEVFEIFKGGSTWQELGRVITPQKMEPLTEITAATLNSIASMGEVQELTNQAKFEAWATGTVAVSETQLASPYSNTEHPIRLAARDPTLGYPYQEVFKDQTYVDVTSRVEASGVPLLELKPGPRYGFTISAWVRLDWKKSGYFMVPAIPMYSAEDVASGDTSRPRWTGTINSCWSLYLGNGYTGFFSKSSIPGWSGRGPSYYVDDRKAPDAWQFKGRSYRHFIFSMEPGNTTARPFRICIDGVCTGSAALDPYIRHGEQGAPAAASCSDWGMMTGWTPKMREAALNQSRLYLARQPLMNYRMDSSFMQTKFFDRVLSEEEAQKLFENDPDPSDAKGRPIRQTVGCKWIMEVSDSKSFRDKLGNDCYWYFRARRTHPVVCDDPTVKLACPVACESFDTCWGRNTAGGESFQIWRQQMEFRTRGVHGTMCVAKSTSAEAEAIKCAKNAPNYERCHKMKEAGEAVDCGPRDCSAFASNNVALLECLGNTIWVPESVDSRIDVFVPCKSIIELNMPECAWDDEGVPGVATQARSQDSWSMSFWYESTRVEECIQPQMRLLDGNGGPFAWLGGMEKISTDKKAGHGWLPGCYSEPYLGFGHIASESHFAGNIGENSADVDFLHTVPGRKHFIMFGRKGEEMVLVQDDMQASQTPPVVGYFPPIAANDTFLKVINVVGDIRMSPITLRSYFPSEGQIALMRFSEQADQNLRMGPIVPVQDQFQKTLLRKTSPFVQKTMLLVPPFLLQRRRKSGTCSSHGSMVDAIYNHGLKLQCSDPYQCPHFTEQHIYACPTNEEATDTHFGNGPVELRSTNYFMEFLASITDNTLLVRTNEEDEQEGTFDGDTRNYLDMMTREAQIVALFYSVEFGITSMLKIVFDTSQGRVRSKTVIEHFVGVDGARKTQCTILLSVCMVLAVLILLQSARSIWHVRGCSGVPMGDKDRAVVRRCVLDACLAGLAMGAILLQFLHILTSKDKMDRLLVSLLEMDWGSGVSAGSLTGMKQAFLDRVGNVQSAFYFQWIKSQASTIVCILLMVRVVYSTSAHPRIELVTRTFELASVDLMHFLALMLIIFTLFALLGTWLFGAQREEFGTPVNSFATLLDSILGPPGMLPIQDARNDVVNIVYVVIFHFLCLFFMLNFILAIIVESYTKVMEEIRQCSVCQNMISDVLSVLQYRWLKHRYKLPGRRKILALLSIMDVEHIELDDLCEEEIFDDQAAAEAFFTHYSKFDFLAANLPDNSELSMRDLGTMLALAMDKIELLQRELLGHKVPKVSGSCGGTLHTPEASPVKPPFVLEVETEHFADVVPLQCRC